MRLVGVCLRNLANRPLRCGLTALGVGIAVASFIALVGTSRGIENAWVDNLAARGTDVLAVRRGAFDPFSGSVDASVAGRLREAQGVEAVAGELVNLVVAEPDQWVIASGWEPSEFLWQSVPLRAGAMPGPEQPRGVVVGGAVAEGLHKSLGDTLTLEERDFVITGISRGAGALDRAALIMPLPAMQEMMDRPGKVTGFHLRLSCRADAARAAQVKEKLAAAFPSLRFDDTREVAEHDQTLRFLRAAAWSVSAIAVLIGVLATLNTLLMSVAERTYDLGVLSALGWPAARILLMIVLEGVLLAGVGSALGVLLGLGALRAIACVPLLHGLMEPAVGVRLVLETACAALLIGVGGSLYPAWRALRLNPVDALRHE
ncbi:MAG: FtsX-like permease family protein [Planctomycetes bacterium]|nr:FtsX-like permease family protein [Planctomycetota bacterium]